MIGIGINKMESAVFINLFTFSSNLCMVQKESKCDLPIFNGFLNPSCFPSLVRFPYIEHKRAYLFMQLLMKGDVAAELFGIIGGHIYYYFQDVLPQLPHFKGFKIFKTPYPL